MYLRITVDGQRTELAISRKCDPERWDTTNGRATGSKEDSKTLIAYLNDVQFKVFELHRKMSEAGDLLTIETLKDLFVGKEEKSCMLIAVFSNL